MMLTFALTSLLVGACYVESFATIKQFSRQKLVVLSASSGGNDFDSILGEGSSYQQAANSLQKEVSSSSSPVIRVPDGSPAASVTLTSSVAASADVFGDDLALEEEDPLSSTLEGGLLEQEAAGIDPLLTNQILKRQHENNLKR